MPADLDVDALICPDRLRGWLDEAVPELGGGPLRASFLHGGTSNVIIALERDAGIKAVLRRPPLDPPPNSEKAMMREARVLAALNGTSAPHPKLFGMHEDPALIGAPFYIMERVDGWAPELLETDCAYPPPFNQPSLKRDLGFALADALVELGRVDYRRAGLEDFGRPEGFLDRQVDRWQKQLESYPARYVGYRKRDLPGVQLVAGWLRTNVPPMPEPGIVHGDFGPPNVMFAWNAPARVEAIIDWELSTIGDPLLDIALLSINLRDEAAPDIVPCHAYFDSTDFPMRGELLRYYAQRSGRSIDHIDYYLTLAQFRMACILEYKVAAAESGLLPPEIHRMFAPMVLHLMEDAAARVARLG